MSYVKPAAHRLVLLGRTDATGERLYAHGISNRDDFVATSCGKSFSHDVGVKRESALIRMEGKAMNCVDDCRNVFAPGGHSTEDARLGGVGGLAVGALAALAALGRYVARARRAALAAALAAKEEDEYSKCEARKTCRQPESPWK